MSLLEMVITTLIFSVVSMLVLEGMSSMTVMAMQSESDADLGLGAQELISVFAEDLSQSGWFFPDTPRNYQLSADPGAADLINDRQLIYFPMVIQQSPILGLSNDDIPEDLDQFNNIGVEGDLSAGEAAALVQGVLKSGLPNDDGGFVDYLDDSDDNVLYDAEFAVREADQVRWLKEDDFLLSGVLPGEPNDFYVNFNSAGINEARYQSSFYARSQEIMFLRAASGGWAADPVDQTPSVLYFEDHPTDPSQYPWRTIDPVSIEEEVFNLLDDDTGLEDAHKDVRDTFFHHDELGVMKMSEFWPHFRRVDEDNDNPSASLAISASTGRPELIPWDRSGIATTPEAVKVLDVLDSPGAWLERTPDNLFNVKVRWETMVPDNRVRIEDTIDVNRPQRMRVGQLRVYTYALLPSPLDAGTGRLVRAYSIDLSQPEYSDPGLGVEIGERIGPVVNNRCFVIDEVLSDYVARVLFDTFRSDGRLVTDGERLGLNEVRVRLFMARRTGPKLNGVSTEVLETSFGLRASSNARANSLNKQALGTQGVGLSR